MSFMKCQKKKIDPAHNDDYYELKTRAHKILLFLSKNTRLDVRDRCRIHVSFMKRHKSR